MHKPTLVAAPVSDNHGNVGRSFRGDVKARRVLRQIAVKIPATPNVTKLEPSGDAATDLHSRAIGERWYRCFFWLLFLVLFLCDRLRCLCSLYLACTPKK
jgi:hypothetical protein